jgi:hypothetical protein
MGDNVIQLPKREPVEMCESGCGPAKYEDDHGVPLCQKCLDELIEEGAAMTPAQRRAYELGIDVIEGGGGE